MTESGIRGLQRAGDETRTRDIFLGKEVFYQLSYTRVLSIGRKESCVRSGENQEVFPCGGAVIRRLDAQAFG
jgi:hypothetical protein